MTISIINGWRESPHQWRDHLLRPIKWGRITDLRFPTVYTITFFGIIVWIIP